MKKAGISRKEVTHERIVEVASRAIRRSGYGGTGVADLMAEAGLTHGGFYAHFASRDAMLAEAADRAGADSVALFERVVGAAPAKHGLQAIIDAYLAPGHIGQVEQGCVLAALCSELPRQSAAVREVATRRTKEFVDLIARQSPDWGQASAHEDALLKLATMLGALVLARGVDDAKLSAMVLDAARKRLSDDQR